MWSLLKSSGDKNIQKDESNHLGKKIFEDICRVFETSDATIAGIEIVLSDEDENVSPVIFEQGHIGIKRWCVPLMFTYAYRMMIDIGNLSSEEVLKLSRCVVICCADCTKAWNLRKRYFLGNQSSQVELIRELHLCRMVHSIHPKSCETFAHRRWILSQLFTAVLRPDITSASSCDDLCKCVKYTSVKEWFEIVQLELDACKLAGELQTSNYNAWSHRLWVVNFCLVGLMKSCLQSNSNNCSGSSMHGEIAKFLIADLENLLKFSEKHVSDISVLYSLVSALYQCTTFVLTKNKLDDPQYQKITSLWLSLLHHNTRMIGLYDDGHEALWVHRRNLFIFFRKSVLHDNTCSGKLLSNGSEIIRNEFTIEKEREIWTELCKSSSQNRETQKKFAQQHLSFIEKFLI